MPEILHSRPLRPRPSVRARRGPSLLGVGLAVAMGVASSSHAEVPAFFAIGDLPGGASESVATGVSEDGSVVVGWSEGTNGREAVEWTEAGGLLGLGALSSGAPASEATAISFDGSEIVGFSRSGLNGDRAVRFTGTGLVTLDGQSCTDCDPETHAFGLSGDGLIAVGGSLGRSGGSSPARQDAVRWPGGGTALSDLGNLSNSIEAGEALGVSADGGVIAGYHSSAGGRDAFVWQGAMSALPRLVAAGPTSATAYGVSGDASTIVGQTNAGTLTLPGGTVVAIDPQAVRWTGAGYATIESLGTLPENPAAESAALDVSQDGAWIVGVTQDAAGEDTAFVWTLAAGMRRLDAMILEDFGIDLAGWQLHEATGVRRTLVSGQERVSIVGRATSPLGEATGFLARLDLPECRDGDDSDMDGLVDFPADPGCLSPTDASERFDCEDGLDNDGDGLSDAPLDPDCSSPSDPTELPDCRDGVDNDLDGLFDYPDDPGCASAESQREDPACSNLVNDDLDGHIDYPADDGCYGPSDLSEVFDCSDGLDNDDDGLVDFPADPNCAVHDDPVEAPACSDGLDDDGNGLFDYPADYPRCTSLSDPIEAPQCGDGVDNDLDGNTDHPADPGCVSTAGEKESPIALTQGDLLVLDRGTRRVFVVDVTTGEQRLVFDQGTLAAPYGLSSWAASLLVADPAAVVRVGGDGTHAEVGGGADPAPSRFLASLAGSDAFVLEASSIGRLPWVGGGFGPRETWFAIDTSTPFGLPALWETDAFAQDESGRLLVFGRSIFGLDLYRFDGSPSGERLPAPSAAGVWLDLDVEGVDSVVLVGSNATAGTSGVYRMSLTTGAISSINTSFGFVTPRRVAVATDGTIYVGDAGTCANGSCTGARLVEVNPAGGSASVLSQGGFVTGEVELVVVPEPRFGIALGMGVALMMGVAHRRATGRRARRA